jgi:hypothetical protein
MHKGLNMLAITNILWAGVNLVLLGVTGALIWMSIKNARPNKVEPSPSEIR